MGAICFDINPDFTLPTAPFDMIYTIDFSADLDIGSDGPHLKIAFTDQDHLKVGSLYSMSVGLTDGGTPTTDTPVPEPSALLLLGVGLLGVSKFIRSRRA